MEEEDGRFGGVFFDERDIGISSARWKGGGFGVSGESYGRYCEAGCRENEERLSCKLGEVK